MSHRGASSTLRTIVLVGMLLLAVCLSTQAVMVGALPLWDSGDPTATEQLVLEYINRARANPTAEGTRLGINMWEGLCDSNAVGVRPPLAMNKILLEGNRVGRSYSVYMWANNWQAQANPHIDGDGKDPGQRMTDAGYNWNWAGENLAWGSSGYSATDLEDFLMIDSGTTCRGHRVNLFSSNAKEVGIGWYAAATPNAGGFSNFLTQDFGSSTTGPPPFLVGVVYNDADGDNFYDIGEGISGVTIHPSAGAYDAISSTSGGYAIPIGTSGSITVTASSSSFGSVSKTVSLTGANVKQDFKKPGLNFGSPVRGSTNTGWSEYPSVAASGNYVYVAWDDDTPVSGSGSEPEIWMRVSNNNGASFGSPKRISTNTGTSGEPSVAASGSYVYVAWEDNTPVSGSGGSYEIWMRVGSNYGASFGSPIRISTNTGTSSLPSVAAIGTYVYVAWEDTTPVSGSGSAGEIWMRVSNNNGASFASPIRMSTNTYWSENPSVAADGTYVYVAWDDRTPVSGSGTQPEIWMRVSANNGASFGSAKRISSNTGWSECPSVAAIGSYVYVAWDDDTPVTGSDSAYEVWMSVSSNHGTSFGSPIRISSNAYNSLYPSIAVGGSKVYVAWGDDTPVSGSGSAAEIWMRVSADNGASFGSAIRITTNTGWSEYPSVAASGSYVYVAWLDNTSVSGSGGSYEIWTRAGSQPSS